MPHRRLFDYIRDGLEAIDLIEQAASGLTVDDFAADRDKLDAVPYRLITIGESVRHLPESLQDAFPDIEWDQIRAMRNYLMHVYWGVEPAIVWQTNRDDLPPLRQALLSLASRVAELDA